MAAQARWAMLDPFFPLPLDITGRLEDGSCSWNLPDCALYESGAGKAMNARTRKIGLLCGFGCQGFNHGYVLQQVFRQVVPLLQIGR